MTYLSDSDRIDARPITFDTITIRVPASGIVRIPDGGYPHEFASMPNGWREVEVAAPSKFVVVPYIIQPPRPWRAVR